MASRRWDLATEETGIAWPEPERRTLHTPKPTEAAAGAAVGGGGGGGGAVAAIPAAVQTPPAADRAMAGAAAPLCRAPPDVKRQRVEKARPSSPVVSRASERSARVRARGARSFRFVPTVTFGWVGEAREIDTSLPSVSFARAVWCGVSRAIDPSLASARRLPHPPPRLPGQRALGAAFGGVAGWGAQILQRRERSFDGVQRTTPRHLLRDRFPPVDG